jgi:hypothetical protein
MWYQIIPRYVERETEGGICGERERGGRWVDGRKTGRQAIKNVNTYWIL